jgi:cytochrome c oxidase subunit 2
MSNANALNCRYSFSFEYSLDCFQSSTYKYLELSSADCPAFHGTHFQEPATPIMDGIYLLNGHLLFITISIVFFVGWIMTAVLNNFIETVQSHIASFHHSYIIEVIWTSVPALILLHLASPSFALLYSLDEIAHSELSLKIFGLQWYWSYETSDFNLCDLNKKQFSFSSYVLTNEQLIEHKRWGMLRLLDTDNRLILLMNTHIRLLITATDVLHSWAVPSFGVKIDACPGRLNQGGLFIKRFGTFYGQCSEICGSNHGFMPIQIHLFYSGRFKSILLKN